LLQGALIGSEEDAGVVTIGDGNRFGHYCSIGVRCADLKYRENDPGHVTIGDNNDIREYVGIHCSSSGDHVTEIGDQNLLMGTVHIGHDAKLGHQNILANGSLLAGHVVLGNRVVVGGASGIAQRCWVGSYSMVGAGSMVVMDVPPYVRVQGDRAKIRGLNKVQFVRSDFSVGEKSALSRLYRDLWLKNSESVKGMGERLDELIQAKKYDDFEHCQHLIEFIYESANTESSMRCKAMCTTLK
jgi:UDP-N-acetylglucosamine acyltransferase